MIEQHQPRNRRAHRSAAYQMLYALDRFDYQISLEELLVTLDEEYEFHLMENDFAYRLVAGVLEQGNAALDAHYMPLLTGQESEGLSCPIQLVLRLAVWEMLYDLSTPAPVLINEYVELAKAYCELPSYRLINGVLDRLSLQKGSTTSHHTVNPFDVDPTEQSLLA